MLYPIYSYSLSTLVCKSTESCYAAITILHKLTIALSDYDSDKDNSIFIHSLANKK